MLRGHAGTSNYFYRTFFLAAFYFTSLTMYAQPCLPGWSYRIPVTVDNSGGVALSSFQVSFTFNTQELIVAGKMQLDGGDLRVLSSTGSVLSHWIEPSTFNSASTKVWVKIPSLSVGVQTIYLFYGNAGASDIANGQQTFVLFDDFNDVGIDPAKWTTCDEGTFSMSNGRLTLSSSASTEAVLRSVRDFSGALTAEMYVHSISGGGAYVGLADESSKDGYGLYFDEGTVDYMKMELFEANANCHRVYDALPSPQALDAVNVIGVWRTTWVATGSQFIDWPGAPLHPVSRANNAHPFNNNTQMVIGHSVESGSVTIDWARLRKYTAVEPGLSLGTEASLVNSAIPGSNAPICEGTNLTLTANTVIGASYSWTGPNGFVSSEQNPTITAASAAATGTYTLTITVPSGCSSASSAISITVFAQTASGMLSGGGAVCEGSNSGTIVLSANVGAPLRWESSSTGFAPWTTISSTDSSLAYTNIPSTIYFRTVIKNGVCPVQYSEAELVEVAPRAKGGSIMGPLPVCEGLNSGSMELIGHLGTIVEWQTSTDNWNTYTPITNTTTSYQFTNLVRTTQYRVLISSGSCPTVYSQVYIVTVHPLPEVDFNAPPVCDMQPMIFDNLSSISSGQITAYLWDFGDGTNSIEEEPSHLFLNPQIYKVTLKATSAYGCSDTISKEVTVNELPVADFTAEDVCLGSTVFFQNLSSIGTGSMSFVWDFGDETSSILTSPDHLYSEAGAYLVVLHATSNAGCINSLAKTIMTFAPPIADAGKDTTISRGFGAQLNASGGINYTWTPTTGLSNSNISNPIANPEETTLYDLLVIDENGCEDTDDLLVTVKKDFRVIISNVLTPDGNGINDTWKIFNIESFEKESHVKVFNRWGREVYSVQGYKNDWMGVDGADILPDGVYYYAVYFDGSEVVYKGAITILRNQK